MSFETTKTTLEDLLKLVDSGKLQLPEFQRDFVWTEDAVVSLLASIARGYPIGALLMLERGGEVDFKPRAIEGAPAAAALPDVLLLDGQQRMTSLYQALFSPTPAHLRNAKKQKVERHLPTVTGTLGSMVGDLPRRSGRCATSSRLRGWCAM